MVDTIRRLYNSGAKPAIILRYISGDPCNDGLLITINDVNRLIRDMKMVCLDEIEAIKVLFHRLQYEGKHAAARLDVNNYVTHLFFLHCHLRTLPDVISTLS